MCVLGVALFASGAARAHDPFEITSDAHFFPDRLELKVIFLHSTLPRACLEKKSVPAKLDPNVYARLAARLEHCALGIYALTEGGAPLSLQSSRLTLTPENDIEVRLVYPLPARSPLRFDALFLKALPDPTYGAVLTVTGQRDFLGQKLLRADDPALEIELSDPSSGTPRAESSGKTPLPGSARAQIPDALPGASPSLARKQAKSPPAPSFGQYLRLGVEHILTGYDHLLFLGGLFLVCRRMRTLLGIVTAFTLAHSLTLALAALGRVSLSSQLVEPLIAATIVFVGVENVLRGEEPKGRFLLAFAFGLIHGFGFAGALRGIGLGAYGTSLAVPLVAFNVGVELGQLGVAAVALPILWQLRKSPLFARYGARALSLVIAAIGLYWFLQRTLLR